ncbi:MAG: sigma-70 family RNA polymerase sigma factor [Gemmataceae bacterium]
MNAADSQRLLQHIRRLAGDPQSTPSDGELLRRYLDAGEEAAFAALVRRHGSMVFSVCQSVLRQRPDAEDAFQATFLILARKAASIRRQEGLGGWLQRVAYRVALKARADHLRRQQREAKTARSPIAEPSADELSWGELRTILHAELAALAESLRAPLVLCYLEGRTQEEAARQLGWSLSTLRGRLQRGRDKLRRRLERRGTVLTAALSAAVTGQALAETSAAALRPFTVETATATAAALADGFGSALAALKWKVLAVLLLSAGLAVGGARVLPPKPAEQGPRTASASKPAAERPAPRTDLYGDPLPEGAIARMGSLRLRHAGQSSFGVLPDSKTILTAGGRAVRFWDIASGRLVRQVKLQGSFAPGRSATPSPDYKILAGACQKKLVFWEIDSGKQIKTLPGLEENWQQMYFSPDSKTLIVGTLKPQVLLLDWQKGVKRRIELPFRQGVWGPDSTFHSCASPDGKYLAAQAGWSDFLCIYDLATGRELHRLSCNASTSTFSSDSKHLIVSSMQNDKKERETVIRIFNVANGKETATYPLGHKNSYFSLDCAPDGKALACAFSDRSCLLDLGTGRVLHPLADRPIRADFTADGKTLVASTGYRLRLWDPATGKVLRDRPGDFGWSPALAVSPDGRLLAAADWLDQQVCVWDTAIGRLLRRLPLTGEKRYVRNLTFSSDGKTLIASQAKGHLQFWDIASGKEQRSVQLHDSRRLDPDSVFFFQLYVSSDGKHVSTLERIFNQRDSTRLASWDAATGKLVSQHLLPPQSRACAWSADGTTVAMSLNEGLTQMKVETGAVRFRIAGTRSGGTSAASPDDRLLAAARTAKAKDKVTIGIWEATTGKEVATVATGQITHFALTPDDRHVVVTDNKSLRVWDMATGKERRRWPLPEANTLFGGNDVVTNLLLSPDGRRAFTALNDGTALVWDLQPALPRGKTGNLRDKEQSTCWTDLAADDARRAYAAIWRLTEAPDAAIPFLRRLVKTATDADAKVVRRLLADLDSDVFATREKASEQVAKLGPLAEPVLRQALEQKPTLEARRRMQLLLEKIDGQPATGEALRLLRALQVLENTGAEGRRLLRELANGAEGAWLTREAKAALARPNRGNP